MNNNSEKKNPDWLRFEKEIAGLFELFGYDDVVHNAKLDGGQCDVVAKSTNRTKSNIIVECKFSSSSTSKVGIVDVQNFINKASNYRNEGKIDLGYLITNTEFTADAKAALNDRIKNYIFLLTYDEFIQGLLDIKQYLEDYIKEYDDLGEGEKFIDLKLLNTTGLDRTIMDSIPGDLLEPIGSKTNFLVIPNNQIEGHIDKMPFLSFNNNSHSPTVKPIEFFNQLQEYYENNTKEKKSHEKQLIKILKVVVKKIADQHKDEILYNLFEKIPKDKIKMIRRSPELTVKTLMDIWSEYGGDSGIKLFRKSKIRTTIYKEIIKEYKTEIKSIKVKKQTIPPLINSFGPHIVEALQIEPGLMFSKLNDIKNWNDKYELQNIIAHLNDQTESDRIILKLLIEEPALNSLQSYIVNKTTDVLVLIGDYGAGKTTIIRKLMRKLSEEKLLNQYDSNYRIPLYITLKDYNKIPDIKNLIKSFLRNKVEVSNMSIRAFKKLNEEGRFILLLDAFDEMLNRVTKADRRRCFKEIAELVTENSKIILTGRPSYFNDYEEFKENVNLLNLKKKDSFEKSNINYEIKCLQLLDEEQVETLIKKSSPKDSEGVIDILLNNPSLMDLARRPVLASMISKTGDELKKLENKEVSVRNVYELYTDKWVKREEDKGSFRLLVQPNQKSIFLRYLAMQMFIEGSLSIHYTELDKSLQKHFDLDRTINLDYFSHDIRTCSFLSRTDDGFYFFMHKSFMEYFVACEFEEMENSPFANSFSNNLTNEIIDLLDFDKLPPKIIELWKRRNSIQNFNDEIYNVKNHLAKKQMYEYAAAIRDIEKDLEYILDNYNSVFVMNLKKSSELYKKFKEVLPKINTYKNYLSDDLVKFFNTNFYSLDS
ncbi:restriction endonuclease [Seonamhaeicola marinus]|uniref:NACHT domain-containing protein n=1 Tax=Seonamhaeicola marinus TaxID=1912246 RepID=A0A5D0HTH6_9FLAO|nr:restriction endonuclease [Seonamhaeicola marinus]TYA74618.1 NACHT domain-containing protein [Seonamhaeicola marinus]